MTLTAYNPLEAVYSFHEKAETWMVRRYSQTITVDEYGEPKRPVYAETTVPLFRDGRTQRAKKEDTGTTSGERCTVYLRHKLRVVDAAAPDTPSFSDVLFDVQGFTGEPGSAWVVVETKGWHLAKGFEHVLMRQGQRGSPPWV